MATLEDAAQDLVEKLEQLDGECQEAQQAFAAQLEGLAELDAGIAQEWDSLSEAVTSFLERVQEQAALLAQDGNDATNELGSLRGEIEGAQSEAEAELVGSRDDVAALAEHLRSLEPAVESLVTSGGEAPIAALRQLAESVREQLEQALGEAGDFLQDVVTELGAVAQDVEERSEALRAHIAEECTEQLQNGFETWQGNVEELEELVKGKLEELPANAREVVEYAMAECVAGHEEELDRVLALIPTIEQEIEQLKSTIDETATDIGEEALGALTERLSSVSQSITTTTEALDRVKQLLASYTFVTM